MSRQVGSIQKQSRLRERSEQHRNGGIVAESLADVREPIYISRSEHETSAELKRILS